MSVQVSFASKTPVSGGWVDSSTQLHQKKNVISNIIFPSCCSFHFPGFLPVSSIVPANYKVLWLSVTHVNVKVILWHQIHIMENETVPVCFFQGLQVPYIQQFSSIKFGAASLWKRREKTSEQSVKLFEPELFPGICFDHIVHNHICVSQPLQQQLYKELPHNMGTAFEWPVKQNASSGSICHGQSQGKNAYGYVGTRSMHAAISLPLLLQFRSSSQAI